MKYNNLLTIRKNWFKLKAKEFISRYYMGLIIIAVFLPGVGTGENLNLIMLAISKPFYLISQIGTSLIVRLTWFSLLTIVFVVWSRAQRLAINGGKFAVFQQSLPIKKVDKIIIDIKMLLLGNHFLWPFIIASYYFLYIVEGYHFLDLVRNTFLVLLLLVVQYISVFARGFKSLFFLVTLCLIFIVPVSEKHELFRMIIVFILMYLLVYYQIIKDSQNSVKGLNITRVLTKSLTSNFYLQIILKSGLTSSLFRVGIILTLFYGFTLGTQFWVKEHSELTPYYFALESIVAYFVSGFFVSFLDQRNNMKLWLVTLPISRHYWFTRDVFVTVILTLVLHVCFFVWAIKITDFQMLINVFIYHILLLLICYPIRIFVTKKQTFTTFVVLFVITAITIINLP